MTPPQPPDFPDAFRRAGCVTAAEGSKWETQPMREPLQAGISCQCKGFGERNALERDPREARLTKALELSYPPFAKASGGERKSRFV